MFGSGVSDSIADAQFVTCLVMGALAALVPGLLMTWLKLPPRWIVGVSGITGLVTIGYMYVVWNRILTEFTDWVQATLFYGPLALFAICATWLYFDRRGKS